MSYSFSASAVIAAPAQTLYDLIADYVNGHPRIVPNPPFTGIMVERGGYGAGTHILVHMRVMGSAQYYRAIVSEPEPGRCLVETNDNGYVSTFLVEPLGDGAQTRVTISTEITHRTGWRAALELWLLRRFMGRYYVEELKLLGAAAGAPSVQVGA